MNIRVEHYPNSRFWAVHLDDKLLCVTVYKKGALAVKAALENHEGDQEWTSIQTSLTSAKASNSTESKPATLSGGLIVINGVVVDTAPI
jgi:hypothetical protein